MSSRSQSLELDLVYNPSDQIKFFISTLMVWTGIFLFVEKKFHFKSLPKKVSDDTKNRIVSILHGSFTFWMATYIIVNNPTSFGDLNQQDQHALMIISMSYFVYDLIACIHYDLSDTSLVVHHALSLSGYLASILQRYGGFATATAIFSAEISNFPMHLRMILRNIGLRYTKLYELTEMTYFFLYAVLRGLCVPFLVYQTLISPTCPTFVKLSSLGLFGQSVYFIFEMKKIYFNLKRQQKERKKLGIEYCWFSVPESVLTLPYTKKQLKKDTLF